MPARDYMPGVPGAGHISTNGYWHPGRATNCHKQPCQHENGRSQPHTFEADSGRRDTCRECGEPSDYFRHIKGRGTG